MKVEADVSTVYVISPSVSCIVKKRRMPMGVVLDGVADEVLIGLLRMALSCLLKCSIDQPSGEKPEQVGGEGP